MSDLLVWKIPPKSRYYIYTDEGYHVSKCWIGALGAWVYTAWAPTTLDPETKIHRPNMLKGGIDTAEEAKAICEEDFKANQTPKAAQRG
ncbi:MAG TPA: hypothetical protein VGE69_14060 [Pseudomonadales bacterium]